MIEVRALPDPEQFTEAVRLQREIWQFEDEDLLPVRLFVVATKIGGQAFGAYDGDAMVGFALAIPGIKPSGTPYLHSHMVGVSASHRSQGVGRMLKMRQREDAIERGIELMELTFDPLEIANAHFNIERLGAIVRRYTRNQYGVTSSELHGGMPTDRCTSEWWLTTPRVEHALAGEPFARPAVERRIDVAGEISKLRSADKERAKAMQAEITAQFIDSFDVGLTVIGFERTGTGGSYLLGRLA